MFSVHDSPQEGEVCTPEGRDCVEEKAGESFNCNIACEGIFADAQWIPEASYKEIEGTDKNNLMRLILEYKEFKKNVRHFRFDSNLTASTYGENNFQLSPANSCSQESRYQNPPSKLSRSTLTRQLLTRLKGTRGSKLKPS